MSEYLVYLLPFIIKSVQEILDAVTDGKKLKDHQVRALQTGYCELTIWGRHLAADTDNTYDDQAVEAVITSIKDLLEEGEFPVPVIG